MHTTGTAADSAAHPAPPPNPHAAEQHQRDILAELRRDVATFLQLVNPDDGATIAAIARRAAQVAAIDARLKRGWDAATLAAHESLHGAIEHDALTECAALIGVAAGFLAGRRAAPPDIPVAIRAV